MKGWVDLDRPLEAAEWLERMEGGRVPSVRPNAVAYAIAAKGLAGAGKPFLAESVLESALLACTRDRFLDPQPKGRPCGGDPAIDRVVFHAVLDAWAASASGRGDPARNHNGPEGPHPSVRALALV